MSAPSPSDRIGPSIGKKLGLACSIAASSGLLSSCMGAMPTPMAALNRQLAMAGTNRAPSLSGRWLAVITGRGGRDQVLLLDVAHNTPVPVPGLKGAVQSGEFSEENARIFYARWAEFMGGHPYG